jgi:AcrR family transcriptional regulator
MRRAERRTSLVQAAAAAFARAGFQGTSMDDVAAEAGVTRLIVYRHFESKEELYRAVLEQVSEHLVEALDQQSGLLAADTGTGGRVVGAMLAVARQNPDGFRLLWVHARREPAFADYAAEIRRGAVAFAEELAGPNAPGAEPLHRWSVDFMVTAAVESVLGWLEHGEAAYDDDFVALATEGLRGMIVAWAGAGTRAGAGGRVTTAGAGAPPPPAG